MKKKDLLDIKNKNMAELTAKVAEIRKSVIESSLELKLGRIKNVHETQAKKKNLAQVMTIANLIRLNEKTNVKKGVKKGKQEVDNGTN